MDSGGPYFTLDGVCRKNSNIVCKDLYVHGCDSLEKLVIYFKYANDVLNDCVVKTYEIPDRDIIIQERQLLFPKKYIRS